MDKRTVLAGGCALLAIGSACGAQDCCTEGFWHYVESRLRIDWQLTGSFTSGTGVAAAGSWLTDLGSSFVMPTPMGPCDPWMVFVGVASGGWDGDSGNLSATLHAQSDITSPPHTPHNAQAIAIAVAEAGLAAGYQETWTNGTGVLNDVYEYCAGIGMYNAQTSGAAWTDVVCTWVPVDGDATWTPTLTNDWLFGFGASVPCCERGPRQPVDDETDLMIVQFVDIQMTVVRSGQADEVLMSQGVFAAFGDGTYVRLGLFEDSAFDPEDDPFGDGWIVEVEDYELPISVDDDDISSLSLTAVNYAFDQFDGNLDPKNGTMVCVTDRALLMDLIGTQIGDQGYSPRADFDLSGEIDVDDLLVFNTLPCSADFDCSGDLDLFDFIAFTNAYNSQDPVADMNGDSDFDQFDYLAFNNAYNVGC